jgi:DNA helicase II / ATP-dependent DNA helicase PcrA
MLARAGTVMTGRPLVAERSLTIGKVTVTARADHVQAGPTGVVIQRLKTGRLARSGETPKARYPLLQAMVQRDERVAVSFVHVSLIDGAKRDTTFPEDKLNKALQDTAAALTGIAEGRFDPKRDARTCPTCPFFFVCPVDGLTA